MADNRGARLQVLVLLVTLAVLVLAIYTTVLGRATAIDDGFVETPEGADAVQTHVVRKPADPQDGFCAWLLNQWTCSSKELTP